MDVTDLAVEDFSKVILVDMLEFWVTRESLIVYFEVIKPNILQRFSNDFKNPTFLSIN